MAACVDCRRISSASINPLSFDNSRSNEALKSNLASINPLSFDKPRSNEAPKLNWPPDISHLPDDRSFPADEVWGEIKAEALSDSDAEPILSHYLSDLILRHDSLESALCDLLSNKLCIPNLLPASDLRVLFAGIIREDRSIGRAACADLLAVRDRDPACSKILHCFLYYKGFLACQAHRVAHRLWITGRRAAALAIQSRSSECLAVDIHPAARIGVGVLLDHATGVVIGETAVVGDDVSIMHNVTLGGTGKGLGDRHPKIGNGVLVGAGSQVLGNVRIGDGAKLGAGSVVLGDVPPRTTAVGNPARLLGGKENPVRLDRLAGLTMEHTSWSDYVI